MSTWEQVNGADHAAWIMSQLRILNANLALEVVYGDESVREMMEDLQNDLGEMAGRWKVKFDIHAEVLAGTWFLDQDIPFAVYSERVPEAELLDEDGGI